MSGHLTRLAARSVFRVDGEAWTWGDAVLATIRSGEWAELESRARHGLAALHRLQASGQEVPAAELTQAARSFRYARELLAAEELDAWLDRRGLSHADWRDHLRRELLRRGSAGSAHEDAVPEDEVHAAAGVDLICGGGLEAAARRLAAQAALAPPEDGAGAEEHDSGDDAVTAGRVLGGEPSDWSERLARLARIEAGAAAARDALADEPAVEHELAEHRLEWLRIELELLDLPHEEAAREAALCVRADGSELGEVAARAGSALRSRRLLLAEADAWLAPHLLGAEEGEVIGPVAHDGGHAVARVRAKRAADAADPELRRRAEAALVQRAAARHVSERVEWHERL